MNHVCESLNHTKWECKYHVVPPHFSTALYGGLPQC